MLKKDVDNLMLLRKLYIKRTEPKYLRMKKLDMLSLVAKHFKGNAGRMALEEIFYNIRSDYKDSLQEVACKSIVIIKEYAILHSNSDQLGKALQALIQTLEKNPDS